MTDIRTQQIEDMRRMTQAESRRPTLRVPNKPKTKKPEGHEAYLKALEASKAEIRLITTAGEEVCGRVKHSDHYTISIDCGGPNKVFFKHSIEQFEALPPADEEDADETAVAA